MCKDKNLKKRDKVLKRHLKFMTMCNSSILPISDLYILYCFNLHVNSIFGMLTSKNIIIKGSIKPPKILDMQILKNLTIPEYNTIMEALKDADDRMFNISKDYLNNKIPMLNIFSAKVHNSYLNAYFDLVKTYIKSDQQKKFTDLTMVFFIQKEVCTLKSECIKKGWVSELEKELLKVKYISFKWMVRSKIEDIDSILNKLKKLYKYLTNKIVLKNKEKK